MWFAINDLDFVLEPTNNFIDSKNKTEIYILNIGLDIINSQTEKYNLINLLKERKIINNYDWFISFEVLDGNKDKIYNLDDILKTKPKLIIGCLPHDYYPKLYFKQNLISDYSFYLNFKDIYYYLNDSTNATGVRKKEIPKRYRKAQINFNAFLIIAPFEYKSMIQYDFFGYYYSKGLCYYYYDSVIEGFYCVKSEKFNENTLKTFPTLYLEHNQL